MYSCAYHASEKENLCSNTLQENYCLTPCDFPYAAFNFMATLVSSSSSATTTRTENLFTNFPSNLIELRKLPVVRAGLSR